MNQVATAPLPIILMKPTFTLPNRCKTHHAWTPSFLPSVVIDSQFNRSLFLTHFSGDTVIMECAFPGVMLEEGTVYSWERFSGVPLPLDRITFACDRQTLVLEGAVSTADAGQYICQAQEPSGRRLFFCAFLELFGEIHSVGR